MEHPGSNTDEKNGPPKTEKKNLLLRTFVGQIPPTMEQKTEEATTEWRRGGQEKGRGIHN